jgi:polysaccharide export outer membrane protein
MFMLFRSLRQNRFWFVVLSAVLTSALAGCATAPSDLPAPRPDKAEPAYLIGPGDTVSVFVWGNPELSATVPVRPDGKITTPLVEDLQASGKTSTALAREIEQKLGRYIRNPVVTVTVSGFVGRPSEQIRVIGQAAEPQSIPYREHMTLLDVMIAVGGLTQYAAGDRATLIRTVDGKQKQYRVRLNDLIEDGDISANVEMFPGDILIIPEAWF